MWKWMLCLVLLLAGCLAACRSTEERTGADPGEIVIEEGAGAESSSTAEEKEEIVKAPEEKGEETSRSAAAGETGEEAGKEAPEEPGTVSPETSEEGAAGEGEEKPEEKPTREPVTEPPAAAGKPAEESLGKGQAETEPAEAPSLDAREASVRAASASSRTDAKTRPHLPIREKDEIVRAFERRMRDFLGMGVARMEEIQARFRKEMKAIPVPIKIQAVETELVEFYRERDEAFERKVLETADRFEKEIRKTLDYLEPQVWKIAFELVGSEDMGTSYGSRTGIDEVDSIAEATLELLRFRSKLNSFRDEVGVYKYKRIGLDRLYKHDIEGEGRFSIFVSDSLHDFFRKNEDVVAVTVTYQRKGLDMQVPLELRQAVRNRIVRGGTVRFDSRFHWDHTLETAGGRLKLENPGTGEVVVVSRVFFPRLNMDSPNFDDYRDFTAVRDYETAVIDKDTGEVLDCVSWQLKWNISHFGSVAVEKGSSPVERADAREIKFLMQAGGETFPKVRRTDAAKERASSSTSKPGTRLPSKAPPPK